MSIQVRKLYVEWSRECMDIYIMMWLDITLSTHNTY
jgi:hypothetical protein